MANIIYTFENQIYLNLTNECPCRCTFCIRNNGDSVGDAETLWHKKTPELAEVISAIDNFDFGDSREIVVCGYGEPTCALDLLVNTCKYIKEKLGFKIRLNTNGLGDLVNGRSVAEEVCRYIDCVSISLNAPTAEKYNAVTRPKFGEPAFEAMLKFARDCKKFINDVRFSVVDTISDEDIEECKVLAASMEIPLRVREYTAD